MEWTMTAGSIATYGINWELYTLAQGISDRRQHGYFWFDESDIDSLRFMVANANVDKLEVLFERSAMEHGAAMTEVCLYPAEFQYSSSGLDLAPPLPSQVPTTVPTGEPISLGTFAVGESRWQTVPQRFLDVLTAMNTSGFRLYNADDSSYVFSETSPKFRLTCSPNRTIPLGGTLTLYCPWKTGASVSIAINGTTADSSMRLAKDSDGWISYRLDESLSQYCGAGGLSNATAYASYYYSVMSNARAEVPFYIRSDVMDPPVIKDFNVSLDNDAMLSPLPVAVKGFSKARLSAAAEAAEGTEITEYRFTGAGYTLLGSSGTTGFLYGTGDTVFTLTVTDSRGARAQAQQTIHVYDYKPPSLRVLTAQRCLSDGSVGSEGSWLLLSSLCIVDKCDIGNRLMDFSLRWRLCPDGFYSEPISLQNGTDVPATQVIGNGSFAPDNSYELTITARDAVTQTERILSIATATYPMHFRNGGTGVAFGKSSTIEQAVEVRDTWAFYAGGRNLAALTPTMIGAAEELHTHEGCISVYYHDYSMLEMAHRFTGTGANGRAFITKAYQAGDVFKVNNQIVSAYTGVEPTEELHLGRWMSFTVDMERRQINFTSGSSRKMLRVLTYFERESMPMTADDGTIALICPLTLGEIRVDVDAQLPSVETKANAVILTNPFGTMPVALNGKPSITIRPVTAYWNGSDGWSVMEGYICMDGDWKPLRLPLITAGVNNAETGGALYIRRTTASSTGGSMTSYSGYMHISSGTSYARVMLKTDPIDLSGFQHICVRARKTASTKNGIQLVVYPGLGASLSAVATQPVDTTLQVYKLDISALNGTHFVGIAAQGYSSSTSQADIYDWWLE